MSITLAQAAGQLRVKRSAVYGYVSQKFLRRFWHGHLSLQCFDVSLEPPTAHTVGAWSEHLRQASNHR